MIILSRKMIERGFGRAASCPLCGGHSVGTGCTLVCINCSCCSITASSTLLPFASIRTRRLLRHWQAVRSICRFCSLKIPVEFQSSAMKQMCVQVSAAHGRRFDFFGPCFRAMKKQVC